MVDRKPLHILLADDDPLIQIAHQVILSSLCTGTIDMANDGAHSNLTRASGKDALSGRVHPPAITQ